MIQSKLLQVLSTQLSRASFCKDFQCKKVVYEGLILSIPLYGSESWCLTERLYNQLRRFHSRCLRSMCRVNMIHTRLYRISTAQLLERIDLLPVDVYITRRQLRWAGHVARMEIVFLHVQSHKNNLDTTLDLLASRLRLSKQTLRA